MEVYLEYCWRAHFTDDQKANYKRRGRSTEEELNETRPRHDLWNCSKLKDTSISLFTSFERIVSSSQKKVRRTIVIPKVGRKHCTSPSPGDVTNKRSLYISKILTNILHYSWQRPSLPVARKCQFHPSPRVLLLLCIEKIDFEIVHFQTSCYFPVSRSTFRNSFDRVHTSFSPCRANFVPLKGYTTLYSEMEFRLLYNSFRLIKAIFAFRFNFDTLYPQVIRNERNFHHSFHTLLSK